MHEQLNNVGTVIQAYLHRSEQDVAELLKKEYGSVLSKAHIWSRRKLHSGESTTRTRIFSSLKMLLESKTYNAIATHDEKIITAAIRFAGSRKIPKDRFEFQMLYGIRRDLRTGWRGQLQVRVYIPYGRKWYPYLMRRLAERPANVAFIVRNMFKG